MHSTNPEGLAIAGGALAAALLDVLVSKGVLTNEEARAALKGALERVKPVINTTQGNDASRAITNLMAGKYAGRKG